jgi:hypothetical protein
MGGGTLDFAVMEVSETHGVSSVSVLASDGTAEAGDSLDEQIANLVKEKSLPHAHVSQLDPIFDQYLLREASNVKHLLSRVEAVPLRLPTPFNDLPEVTLERKDIEELFEPQMTRAKNLVIHVLREARLCVGDSLTAQEVRKIPFEQLREGIDDVFLVGGMTQIPLVRRLLSEFFPDSQVLSQQEFDRRSQGPHQSVALGLVARVEPEKLSLMRPQVEVVLMYEGADGNDETQVLYPAFTKLRQSDQVGNFRFVTESKKVETSKKLEGKIRFRTPSGRLMPVDVFRRDNDDSVMSEPVTYDGLPVALSRYSGVSLSISLQGRIVIRDAAGIDTFFRIHAWPMMKWSGDSSSVPRIQLVPPKGEPLPQYYENDPYHK